MDEYGLWLPVHVTFDLKCIFFRVCTQQLSKLCETCTRESTCLVFPARQEGPHNRQIRG